MEVRCCFLGDTVGGHDWVSRLAFFVQSSGLLSTVFPVRFPVAIWSSLHSVNFLVLFLPSSFFALMLLNVHGGEMAY